MMLVVTYPAFYITITCNTQLPETALLLDGGNLTPGLKPKNCKMLGRVVRYPAWDPYLVVFFSVADVHSQIVAHKFHARLRHDGQQSNISASSKPCS